MECTARRGGGDGGVDLSSPPARGCFGHYLDPGVDCVIVYHVVWYRLYVMDLV